MKNFVVLGIDTSGENCSVGLVDDRKVIGDLSLAAPQAHSSQLIPLIDKILKDNNLKIQDVGGIAISIGPGCFTGLRVGVATAKALAQGLEIPIVGISTLDVIAMNAAKTPHLNPLPQWGEEGERRSTFDGRRNICVIVDARKQQVYTAEYSVKCQVSSVKVSKIKKITKDIVASVEELIELLRRTTHDARRTTIFLGNAIPLYGDTIKEKLGEQTIFADKELWYPRASNVALAGLEKLQQNKKGDNLFKLKPIYLREPDIRKPNKK